MKNKLIILFLTAILTQSCTFDKPEDYFAKTTLNINKYSDMGLGDFQQMRRLQNANAMYAKVDGEFIPSNSYEAHIKTLKIYEIEKDIEKIKNLKSTEDTKKMISASLEVFNFVKSKYETGYVKIAKLMDDKVDQNKIDLAIKGFEKQNLSELNKKINSLMDIALPYAENNRIDVKFY